MNVFQALLTAWRHCGQIRFIGFIPAPQPSKTQFSKILQRVARGEEVIILNRTEPVARISPIPRAKRRLGLFEGKIIIADDFDKTPKDFEKYTK